MLLDDRMRNLAKLMDVAVLRGRIHAANLAHRNTPGYKARAVAFDEAFIEATAQGRNAEARALEPRIYEPRTTQERMDGNDVSPTREVIAQSKNALLYQAYIAGLRGKFRLLNTAMATGA